MWPTQLKFNLNSEQFLVPNHHITLDNYLDRCLIGMASFKSAADEVKATTKSNMGASDLVGGDLCRAALAFARRDERDDLDGPTKEFMEGLHDVQDTHNCTIIPTYEKRECSTLGRGTAEPNCVSQPSNSRVSDDGPLGGGVNILPSPRDPDLSIGPTKFENTKADTVDGIADIGHSTSAPRENICPSGEGPVVQRGKTHRRAPVKRGALLHLLVPFNPDPKSSKPRCKPSNPKLMSFILAPQDFASRCRTMTWGIPTPLVDTPPASPTATPPTSPAATPPASPEKTPASAASTLTSSTNSRLRPLTRTVSHLSFAPPASPSATPPASNKPLAAAASTSTSSTNSRLRPLTRTDSHLSFAPIISANSIASASKASTPVASSSTSSMKSKRSTLARTASVSSLAPMIGGGGTSVAEASTASSARASASNASASTFTARASATAGVKNTMKKRARDGEWDTEAEATRPTRRARRETGKINMATASAAGSVISNAGVDGSSALSIAGVVLTGAEQSRTFKHTLARVAKLKGETLTK